MNSTKKKTNLIGILNQEPLRVINRVPYNPLIHTPPPGLEKHVILEPTMYPSRTIVRQHPPADFKPGPDMDTANAYGQFVELGGKRRIKHSKRRRSKKSIRKSIRKRRSKKHHK